MARNMIAMTIAVQVVILQLVSICDEANALSLPSGIKLTGGFYENLEGTNHNVVSSDSDGAAVAPNKAMDVKKSTTKIKNNVTEFTGKSMGKVRSGFNKGPPGLFEHVQKMNEEMQKKMEEEMKTKTDEMENKVDEIKNNTSEMKKKIEEEMNKKTDEMKKNVKDKVNGILDKADEGLHKIKDMISA